MDKVDNILDQGDKYVKYLSDRCQYSRTYRRQRSVMEALNKNSVISPSNHRHRHYDGNPFEKEFSQVNTAAATTDDNQLEMTYVSTWPEDNSDLFSRTYIVEAQESQLCTESLDEGTTSHLVTEQRSAKQLRSDIVDSEVDSTACSTYLNLTHMDNHEFTFCPSKSKDIISENLLNIQFAREFQQRNSQMQYEYPDESFDTQVVEICEPTIVKFHHKSCDFEIVKAQTHEAELTYVIKDSDNGKKESNMISECASSSSLSSEDFNEIDREIDKLQFEENENHSDKAVLSPKESVTASEKENSVNGKDDLSIKESSKEVDDIQKGASIKDARSGRNQPKTIPFIKRHTSFLFKKLRTPKLIRRKSSIGSIREMSSNADGSSLPQAGASALSRSNTIDNSDTEKSITRFQLQVQQAQNDSSFYMDDTMSSEIESFLKVAVTNGQCNSTMLQAYSDSRDRNDSILSNNSTYSGRTNDRPIIERKNEPAKHSGTLNRTLSIYKTMTKKIRDKFQRYDRNNTEPDVLSTLDQQNILLEKLDPEIREIIKKLQEKVNVQDTRIYQTSKALQLCDSMREFTVSPERVEYERLLLLASLVKNEILSEIDRLMNPRPDDKKEVYTGTDRGEITLKDVCLQLREDVFCQDRQNSDIIEWYVVVIAQGLTVWATHAIACPISSPKIRFSDKHTISGLTPDFCLSIKVYSMKLQQQYLFNHDDKYHISKSHSVGRSINKTKTISRNKSISPKQHKVKFRGIKKTSFVLCGGVDLKLPDLQFRSHWFLNSVSPDSVLQGTIEIKLSCKLELSMRHAGFLTHCEETGDLAWNRRWCMLEGHTLFFWNYPREQEYNAPLYIIDLVNCASNSIDVIDRKLCPRPKTLLLEIRSEMDVKIVVSSRFSKLVQRHLLSCDNNNDLSIWQTKLNHVISALNDWHIISKTEMS